jgi:hypothetical protein
MTQQSPIDWSNAPAWAQYAAQDADGWWYWYEKEPYKDGKAWGYAPATRCTPVIARPTNWAGTLQKRPET